tara:strand:- start:15 stop:170 length:156 start_codon:yes stop_codon:yes gene_type:complete
MNYAKKTTGKDAKYQLDDSTSFGTKYHLKDVEGFNHLMAGGTNAFKTAVVQ